LRLRAPRGKNLSGFVKASVALRHLFQRAGFGPGVEILPRPVDRGAVFLGPIRQLAQRLNQGMAQIYLGAYP
jgi:hypothetical protein